MSILEVLALVPKPANSMRKNTVGGFVKYRPGARSAAGGMTAWSLTRAGAQAQSLRSHETLQARGPA